MDEVGVTIGEGDREAGVAMWRQIARTLEQEIAGGTLLPGARLPTEAQLALRFAVNRHTVRRAVEELSRGGLVRVEQGRGSFVAEDVLDYAVGPRTRFSEWIRRHNKEPGGRILELAEIEADEAIAAGLGLPVGAPVVMLERLGLADDRPVSLGQHYFPAVRFPGLLAALRANAAAGDAEGAGGISRALAACGLADYRRQTTRVSACMPSPREAMLLRMQRNRPLLVTENINVDAEGAVVEYGTARYPTPRVQIVFEP